jgi:peptidoglycan glycosyltransferase
MLVTSLVSIVVLYKLSPPPVAPPLPEPPKYSISRHSISTALAKPMADNEFPETLPLTIGDTPTQVTARYTIDFDEQMAAEKLIESYKPDYAAFVALNAVTGQVLTIVSYTREPSDLGNLALRSSFPAASVFKIVTAAAALDEKKATPETEISFNGANHTLYRHNITDTRENRWTRKMTLKEAFAKSVNTVFGKLGMTVTPPQLRAYAQRFQFNRFLASDIPVQPSQFLLPEENPWVVAEVASGFNRYVTISPVQGAMMAAAAANDGKLMTPYLIEQLTSDKGVVLYKTEPQEASIAMSPEAATALRAMMVETVERGTSRKTFRRLLRRPAASEIEMGGKTGSLTGANPKGKYDWFVGFARNNEERIAVAALTINEKNWRVKSSFLAQAFFENHFDIQAKRGR